MTKTNNLLYGFGINDSNELIKINKKHIKSYQRYIGMLQRCYSPEYHNKKPTYIECTVCDEWKYFSVFKQWFDENYIEGFALDKDILVEGNKVYSPETCRFVPIYLNSLLNDRRNDRGDLPIGVSCNRGAYSASCSDGYGNQIKYYCKTISQASAWYVVTKKRIVKEQAQRAFLANEIKSDVYLALVRRNF